MQFDDSQQDIIPDTQPLQEICPNTPTKSFLEKEMSKSCGPNETPARIIKSQQKKIEILENELNIGKVLKFECAT